MSVLNSLSAFHRTKVIVVHCVCLGLLISGCSSLNSITVDEKTRLMDEPSENIEVTLKDGTSFKADAYHYLFIDTPGHFIYGNGKLINTSTGESEEFVGKIHPLRVDSGYVMKAVSWSGQRKMKFNDFWVSESLKIRFKAGDFLTVRADSIPSLWYINQTESWANYSRRVEQVDIRTVEVQKYSATKTTLLIVGMCVTAALIVAGAALQWGDYRGSWVW